MNKKICLVLILIGSLSMVGCNKGEEVKTDNQPVTKVEESKVENTTIKYDVENTNIDKAGEVVEDCRSLCNITYSTIAQTDKINCWITLEGNKQELSLHKSEIINLIKTIPNYKTITIRLTESGMAYPFSDEKIIK